MSVWWWLLICGGCFVAGDLLGYARGTAFAANAALKILRDMRP